MKSAKKNMEEKWDRLADVAEGGIANIKPHRGVKNIFIGNESISVNGVPEWTIHREFNKRVKEVDIAERI
jgi:hypothetical protein